MAVRTKNTIYQQFWKIFIFLCVILPDASEGHPLLDIGDSEDTPDSKEAKYSFDWSVSHEFSNEDVNGEESVEFGHEESRIGDDYTTGSYYIQLPGNRIQIVEYYVRGDSGFVAKVRVVSNNSMEEERIEGNREDGEEDKGGGEDKS